MDTAEMTYLSESLDELFDELSYGTAFYFVPLLKEGFDLGGKPNLIFDEAYKEKIHAAIHYGAEGDADIDVNATMKYNRREALIQISVWGRDRLPQERDAFDFVDNKGKSFRYVILGVANGVAMPQLYKAYRVTLLEDFLRDYMGA